MKYIEINVSVPLRGVNCFEDLMADILTERGFRPLAGRKLFQQPVLILIKIPNFRPLAGRELFRFPATDSDGERRFRPPSSGTSGACAPPCPCGA